MILIENVEVVGWETAIRGVRNPMNSWNKSDSWCDTDRCHDCSDKQVCDWYSATSSSTSKYRKNRIVGPEDLRLMLILAKQGSVHAKYRRMITVYMDITAPLYWWKEFDTYKVGTVANSCSTMHKIHSKEFTLNDFSCEHLIRQWGDQETDESFIFSEFDVPLDGEEDSSPTIKFKAADSPLNVLEHTIEALNQNRNVYLTTKDKRFWWQMIQLLPSSYNQKRTIMLNYEVLSNIYFNRRVHKLDEWRQLCERIKELPYSEIITLGEI